MRGRAARQEADALADRLLGVGGRVAEPTATALRRLERGAAAEQPSRCSSSSACAIRIRRVTPALRWLDERLAAQGTTADEIVRDEHQRQGAMNVTVRNVITSMRLISALDWAEFFESVSLVDAVLRAGSDFAAMDFATRDRYRHAIEELARGSRPRRARGRAARAVAQGGRARRRRRRRTIAQRDPGYYLHRAAGVAASSSELGFRAGLRRRLVRAYVAAGIAGYLGTIALAHRADPRAAAARRRRTPASAGRGCSLLGAARARSRRPISRSRSSTAA